MKRVVSVKGNSSEVTTGIVCYCGCVISRGSNGVYCSSGRVDNFSGGVGDGWKTDHTVVSGGLNGLCGRSGRTDISGGVSGLDSVSAHNGSFTSGIGVGGSSGGVWCWRHHCTT
jgi:hypothetical protein